MGISPQDFRIRTGIFYSANMKQKYKTENKPGKPIIFKNCACKVAFSLTLLFLVNFLVFNLTSELKKRNANLKPSLEKCFIKTDINQKTNQNFIICWSQCGLSINKIQKIINGNRRLVGYKLAVWNCARGLYKMDFQINLLRLSSSSNQKSPIALE